MTSASPVLWMDRDAILRPFRMEGAFNDLVAPPPARRPGVREGGGPGWTGCWSRTGGLGAVGRELQPSNYIIQGELQQLRQFALVVPHHLPGGGGLTS